MQEARMQQKPQADIEYPRDQERIDCEDYSFRILAPQDSQKVELSIDNGAWQPCRRSDGHYWFDWHSAEEGEHEAVLRIQRQNGEQIIRTRRFEVELGRPTCQSRQDLRQAMSQQQPEVSAVTQFLVQMPNRPEELERLAQLLERRHIQLEGLMTLNLAGTAFVQFVTDRQEDLRQALEKAGFQVIENQALQVKLPKEPSALSRLLQALAEQDIQLEGLYGTADGDKARLILTTEQPEQARRALESARQTLALS